MALATANVSYVRQNLILDPDKAAELPIAIAGAGTVGSYAAYCLAKAGFKTLTIADMDEVEPHNLPSQAFMLDQLGENKAEALGKVLLHLTDEPKLTIMPQELMGGEHFDAKVMISAVDNMEVRKSLFTDACLNKKMELFMDFRMGGNYMKCWAFNPHDERRAKQYAATLHSSSESVAAECGGRTFAPMGPLVGSFATQIVTKYLREDDYPPFHMDWDFDNFIINRIGAKPLED